MVRSLRSLLAIGCRRVAIVLPPDEASLVQTLNADPTLAALDIEAIIQERPEGTAAAVSCAAEWASGDALLLMGDAVMSDEDWQLLAEAKGFTMMVAPSPTPERYGAVEVAEGQLRSLVEKPAPDQVRPGVMVSTGIFRVPRPALEAARSVAPSSRGEYEFTDVVKQWIPSGVTVLEAGSWFEVGTPWDLLDGQERLMPGSMDGPSPGTLEEGVHVRGRLRVGEGSVIRSGTYIEGDVIIGDGCRIGPNAYLRGPITVGDGCHIGAATEVKNSILMDGAKAPHHNYVGDSLLGPGCNLGSGTKIANLKIRPGNVKVDWDGERLDTGRRKFGAVIGADAKTGINVSINPGSVLAAGSLVPAGEIVTGWT